MADTAATQSKIDDWVTTNYAATPAAVAPTAGATSGAGGMLAAASSPAAAAAPAVGAPAPAAAAIAPAAAGTSPSGTSVTPNINSWYQSVLGRDADAAGKNFWQQALDSGRDAQGLYQDFVKSASTNNERVKSGTSWESANNYTGPQSTDQTTSVDDWGRNVLGRNLTGSEQSQWSQALSAAATPEAAHQVYSQFLQSMGGQVKNSLDFAGASQINAGTPNSQYQPVLIDQSQLAHRTIDQPTETVQGQLKGILAADSPVMQQARNDAMRAANDRGMLNSAMAASGGEDAVIRAATGIATTDSGYYNRASDYNAAAENQLLQMNQQAQNNFLGQSQQIDATAKNTDKTLAAQKEQQASQLAQSMTLAQMQDQTTRWQQEQQTANSRYNTDAAYKQQVDTQKMGVANNIIANMDISPDRKAAMLEQLGFGTSAKDGQPGTGLAGAVYVIDSTSADLKAREGADQFINNLG